MPLKKTMLLSAAEVRKLLQLSNNAILPDPTYVWASRWLWSLDDIAALAKREAEHYRHRTTVLQDAMRTR